jgi:hypothetical protein
MWVVFIYFLFVRFVVLCYVGAVGFSPLPFQSFLQIVISFVKCWGVVEGASRVSDVVVSTIIYSCGWGWRMGEGVGQWDE